MPKDWTRRTRLKVALVAAVLGLLVWADARSQEAHSQECTSYGTGTTGPHVPGETAHPGVGCTGP